MTDRAELSKLVRGKDLNFWGVVIGLIGLLLGAVGLYAAFHVKQPNIRFEIAAEANVLDIRQTLSNLQIFFEGQDIQQNNLNLRIMTLHVVNDGEIDILQTQYDQTQPFGFKLTTGRIIELRRPISPSPYIASALQPRLTQPGTVEFQKII